MLTVGTRVAWSADGRRFALAIGGWGSLPGRLELWQVSPLATCHQVHGLDAPMALAFSPDSRRLAVADGSGAWLVAADTGRVLARLPDPDHEGLHLLAFSPDGGMLLTGHWDGLARLWDGVTGQLLRVLPGHEPVVAGAKFSETGTLVATADRTSAQVWDLDSGHLVRSIEVVDAHDDKTARAGATGALALDAAEERLVTVHEVGGRRSLFVWDLRTGELLHELRGVPGGAVADLRFSEDGRAIEIRTLGERAGRRTWEPGTWAERTDLPNASGVATMGFSPDGRFVHAVDMMMSAPALVRLWDAASRRGERVLVPEPWASPATGLLISWDSAWSLDGQLLAVGYSDRADIWRAESGERVAKLFFHDHHPQGPENPYSWLAMDLEFSPDGRSLAMATTADTVIVWDVASSEPRLILSGDERSTSDPTAGLMIGGWKASFSPDGRAILQCSFQHETVTAWDAETGEALLELRHEAGVQSALWSPDGRRVATGTREGTVTIWDADSAERIATFQVERWAGVRGFTPDGTRLLVSHAGGLSVHETGTGRLLRLISGEGTPLVTPEWSPDGRLVAAGVRQVGLRVWRTDTWEEVVTLPGEVGALDAVRWSPDSRSLAVWQPPGGIRLLPVDVASVARSHPIVVNRRFDVGPLPESGPPAVRMAGVR
jgi:WD40 repeat protein